MAGTHFSMALHLHWRIEKPQAALQLELHFFRRQSSLVPIPNDPKNQTPSPHLDCSAALLPLLSHPCCSKQSELVFGVAPVCCVVVERAGVAGRRRAGRSE